MEFLDLFSGIGGFRRGLERSGHKCVGHVEIDKYANISYMAMYGLVYCRHGKCGKENCCRICRKEVSEHCDGTECRGEWFAKDIKLLSAGEIPRAEIWTFGFPCTDISLSGKRAGLAGERSGLFFTVAGLLKSTPAEDKPGILIVENVKHLLSSKGGGDFTAVLFNLWEAGYDLEWQCVNSKDFGVPQHRERVYLVGYFGGIRGRKIFPVSGANTAVIKKIVGGHQGERIYDSSGLGVTLTAGSGGVGGRTGLYLCGTKKPEEWLEWLRENGSERQGNTGRVCSGSGWSRARHPGRRLRASGTHRWNCALPGKGRRQDRAPCRFSAAGLRKPGCQRRAATARLKSRPCPGRPCWTAKGTAAFSRTRGRNTGACRSACWGTPREAPAS